MAVPSAVQRARGIRGPGALDLLRLPGCAVAVLWLCQGGRGVSLSGRCRLDRLHHHQGGALLRRRRRPHCDVQWPCVRRARRGAAGPTHMLYGAGECRVSADGALLWWTGGLQGVPAGPHHRPRLWHLDHPLCILQGEMNAHGRAALTMRGAGNAMLWGLAAKNEELHYLNLVPTRHLQARSPNLCVVIL